MSTTREAIAARIAGARGSANLRASRGAPDRGSVLAQFTPWQAGSLVNAGVPVNVGYTWFRYALALQPGTRYYAISNYTDSTLYLSDVAADVATLQALPLATIGPYHAAIVALRGGCTFLCKCAGYDFTTARPQLNVHTPFEETRGPGAIVRVEEVSPDRAGEQLPSLRSQYRRVYDWYDLTYGGSRAAITIQNSGDSASLPNLVDATGATAGSLFVELSGITHALVQMQATSPISATLMTIASADEAAIIGDQVFKLDIGTSSMPAFVIVYNLVGDNTHAVVWSDATVVLLMTA